MDVSCLNFLQASSKRICSFHFQLLYGVSIKKESSKYAFVLFVCCYLLLCDFTVCSLVSCNMRNNVYYSFIFSTLIQNCLGSIQIPPPKIFFPNQRNPVYLIFPKHSKILLVLVAFHYIIICMELLQRIQETGVLYAVDCSNSLIPCLIIELTLTARADSECKS